MLALPVLATGGVERVDGPATAIERADAVSPLATDVVTVYDRGALDRSTAERAVRAARAAGGTAAIGRSASFPMLSLRRGATIVQEPPAGWAIPMGTTVLPPEVVGRIMGREVAGVLRADTVVMGSLTAGLRGARAGDDLWLASADGRSVRLRIAAVVDDAVTGGTELLMTTAAADRLGLDRLSRVVIWGFQSRQAIDDALRNEGLVRSTVRIRRSWDPRDPDSTLGMARTKELLGEFAYRVDSGGSVTVSSAWKAANLPAGLRLLNDDLEIWARCHLEIEPDLRAALEAVVDAGLEATIEVDNANTFGGCYNPRFNRLYEDSSVGFLSRHTWAQAFDTNTVSNCQGCAPPPMDCRTVRIFREHGFAWGGNFLTPDGMHFEWVGEPRHELAYPSRYCPNTDVPTAFDPLPVEQTERAVLFADDGLIAHAADEH